MHIRLGARVFIGQDGLRQWRQSILRDHRETLILASSHVAQKSNVLKDILSAFDDSNPSVEIKEVEHPREDQAREVNHILNQKRVFRIVAIGGGSILDLAKASLYLSIVGGFDEQSSQFAATDEHPVHIVAVPTTLSGAEVNPGFGIVDSYRHKKVFWNESIAPREVVCHPEAFKGMPVQLLLSSGVNAIAHCLEGLYTRARDPWCDPLALDALELLLRWLPDTKQGDPSPMVSAELQRASVEAGWVAFGSKPGLHHAICHVLGSHLGIGHAISNVIILPHVIQTVPPEAWGSNLGRVISSFQIVLNEPNGQIWELVRAFINHLFGGAPRLRDHTKNRQMLSELAKKIVKLPLSHNHPVQISVPFVEEILQKAW